MHLAAELAARTPEFEPVSDYFCGETTFALTPNADNAPLRQTTITL